MIQDNQGASHSAPHGGPDTSTHEYPAALSCAQLQASTTPQPTVASETPRGDARHVGLDDILGFDKPHIRRLLRAQRRARLNACDDATLVAQGLAKAWENARLFFGLPPRGGFPALFIPTSSEPPVLGICARHQLYVAPVLVGEGAVLSVPAWGRMSEDDELVVVDNRWPAQPPHALADTDEASVLAQVDMVLLPALAVDEDGVRLGQGGGWYDRALAAFTSGTPKIAAVFDDEVFPAGALPLEAHDELLDGVITPTRFIPLPTHTHPPL